MPSVLQIFFHCSGYESLYEYVPRDALPREYGGKLDSMQDLTGESGQVRSQGAAVALPLGRMLAACACVADKWNEKLVSLRPWFLREQLISRSDETRRPPGLRSATASALASDPEVHGTFRQLSID